MAHGGDETEPEDDQDPEGVQRSSDDDAGADAADPENSHAGRPGEPAVSMPGFLAADLLKGFDIGQIVGTDPLEGIDYSKLFGMGSFLESFMQLVTPDYSLFKGLAPLLTGTLSRSEDFARPNVESSSYSPELRSAGDYFKRHEVVIDSFDALHVEIRNLTDKVPELPLVWRGVRSSDWGLHSNLFRRLMEQNGVEDPASAPTGPQPYPDENQMVDAETKLLRVARAEWRLDGTPALELLAKLQHFGAPTRLLDVTRNPYIGAWFAVENNEATEDDDARLFAIATRPAGLPGHDRSAEVILDETGSLHTPFWHFLKTAQERQRADWGTGSRRRVWVPPAYDPRIVAQNAAFILDGVPMMSARTGSYFKKSSGSKYWTKADLLASSSIYAKTQNPRTRPQSNRANLAPTYSFRITAKAKPEIRKYLERRFAYTTATIYPDIARLSQYLSDSFSDIVR
ncbi:MULTISPECIES: FRG domain-containing protein [unclassified Microbacterium]|uniref:FRG domain-containing protein n=1 Tax=unclassified Microbacterium TaxID=2609290 RepID=UPI000EAA2A52|nr:MULTISPECIES: FRG domain-containing protein [unclassified Microbacterium]MBT2485728.1 FRG domain-containing protein [Microbacterium sp. ISL-108]RKN68496.1 FRG domain-containing protein [Microbacterium sp. CGR2]